jgi:bifunctional non-homologous end joining protein LigD
MTKKIRTNSGQPNAAPGFIPPQLATLVDGSPTGGGWINEIKLDGYRMLCQLHEGQVTFWSRNRKVWTAKLPTLSTAIGKLKVRSALMDGEVVSLDPDGRSDFARLKEEITNGDENHFVYDVFDLLFLDGEDLRRLPLLERKAKLKRLLKGAPRNVRYLDHIVGRGAEFFTNACVHGLEGIIAKRADAPYSSGRNNHWLKIKCTKRQELVVAGYTPPSAGGHALGSLIMGVHDKKKGWVYAGRVGTGFSQKERKRLKDLLDQRQLARPPFKTIPDDVVGELRGALWAKPELVAEIEFTEWTSDGRLRHPSYQGLREDKEATAVVREKPKPIKQVASAGAKAGAKKSAGPVVAGVRISNPDREIFPEGVTKLDLAEHYERVADWMMPHVVNRPLTLVRCPGGITGECFFQKHAGVKGSLPPGIQELDPGDGGESFLNVRTIGGIVGMVQMGTIEFHISGAHSDKPDFPDRLVFDLDPAEGIPAAKVVAGAREFRSRLAEQGLETFVMTTGGKGLHVVAPIDRTNDFSVVRDFAHRLVDGMERDSPKIYIAESGLAKRPGKIFLDYMRNGRGATAICPFAVRSRAQAPVAVTLTWDELKPTMLGTKWTVKNVQRRLSSLKADPWADYGKVRQRITKEMLKKKL